MSEYKSVDAIRAAIDEHTLNISHLEMELSKERQQLKHCRKQLEKRTKPISQPRVSDHAILRYLEREFDLDIDAIRKRILTPEVVSAIKMGAHGVKVDGVCFKVSDQVITTVTK